MVPSMSEASQKRQDTRLQPLSACFPREAPRFSKTSFLDRMEVIVQSNAFEAMKRCPPGTNTRSNPNATALKKL